MSKVDEALEKMIISHEIMAYRYNEYLNHNDENYQTCINPNWEEEINTIKQALEDKDNRIKELEEQSDITLNTLFNQKDGTVTLSSERYDSEERQIISMSKKLDKIKEEVDKVFKEYTKENGKITFCGNDLLAIKNTLEED